MNSALIAFASFGWQLGVTGFVVQFVCRVYCYSLSEFLRPRMTNVPLNVHNEWVSFEFVAVDLI